MRIVDLFCGAGGSSTGAAMAGGSVLAAVNHWPIAVRTHASNHVGAMHFCQDAALLDPSVLPVYDVLLASPDCRGHTRARGTDRPHHDSSRATAWCVVNVAELTRPRAIVVENVPEFRDWPLYRHWRGALETMGYAIREWAADAADYGVPQNRRRLFVVCLARGASWSAPAPVVERITARQILDLDGGRWSPVAGHCRRTVERIARGRSEHGDVFLAPYYGSGSGTTGRSLDRPLGTVTTRDRWALIRGDEMRMLTPVEYSRAMGFPASYVVHGTRAQRIHQLGNAVCPPVMRSLLGGLST